MLQFRKEYAEKKSKDTVQQTALKEVELFLNILQNVS